MSDPEPVLFGAPPGPVASVNLTIVGPQLQHDGWITRLAVMPLLRKDHMWLEVVAVTVDEHVKVLGEAARVIHAQPWNTSRQMRDRMVWMAKRLAPLPVVIRYHGIGDPLRTK